MDNSTIGKDAPVNNKKLIKKQRVMRYFIDAALDIVSESGTDAVTIRSVADRAGYNSASIYNYFDDIDQLMAFASIDLVIDWISEVTELLKSEYDAVDKYVLIWETYVRHSVFSPLCYAYIYDSVHMEMITEYLDSYFLIYPEAKEKCPVEMFDRDKLLEILRRENTSLDPCVEEGFFKKEDADKIYNFVLLLSNGILWSATHYKNRSTNEEYTDRFMQYFIEYLQGKLCKQKDLSKYLKK